MPSKKPGKFILFTQEQFDMLGDLWREMTSRRRRGTVFGVSQKLSLNQFIAGLTLTRAEQIRTEMAQEAVRKR